MKIEFTKDQLYWIERTADFESAMAMQKFVNLTKTNIKDLGEKEQDTLKKIGSELIDLYTFLKELRAKLEYYRK